MNIRDSAIAKLKQLSEPFLQEVSDFIDFVIHKHQAEIADSQPDETLVEAWSRWFDAVDRLDITPPEPASNYTSNGHNLSFFKGLKPQGQEGIEFLFVSEMSLI